VKGYRVNGLSRKDNPSIFTPPKFRHNLLSSSERCMQVGTWKKWSVRKLQCPGHVVGKWKIIYLFCKIFLHPNPLVQKLSAPNLPHNPPRRLKRQWPRDLIQQQEWRHWSEFFTPAFVLTIKITSCLICTVVINKVVNKTKKRWSSIQVQE
jgi:hypothetical protein